jgi:23S rRNA (adenine2503-C2)-methyltransferase
VRSANWLNSTPGQAWSEIAEWVRSRGLPDYRARQIHPYLWERPMPSWHDATDLPDAVRKELERSAPLARMEVLRRQHSSDGTVKLLFRLPDAAAIESVWIPEGRRRTLCISSQAGCAYGCVFCATGRMGFQRHLEPWEIAGQVRAVTLDPELGTPTNVVFMGMGEPLHNWPAVDTALTILNDPRGLNLGARHITVSTIGILPRLEDFGRRPEQFRLAVSLHAATSERRSALMPIERKYPLDQLVVALDRFRRRITLEYVMIEDANDRPEDADALAAIATRLGAHVNLLPLHPGGAPGLTPTPARDIDVFAKRLETRGVAVTVRRSRGLDISAACGQLRIETGSAGGVVTQHDGDVEE